MPRAVFGLLDAFHYLLRLLGDFIQFGLLLLGQLHASGR
jgi:hypothetical protein